MGYRRTPPGGGAALPTSMRPSLQSGDAPMVDISAVLSDGGSGATGVERPPMRAASPHRCGHRPCRTPPGRHHLRATREQSPMSGDETDEEALRLHGRAGGAEDHHAILRGRNRLELLAVQVEDAAERLPGTHLVARAHI